MSRNQALFERAQHCIPGGVNSPVRAFLSVGGVPRFFARAQGPYVWDADGQRYIDYIGSWGPALLGHAHPEVVEAVQQAATRGLSFGAPCEAEVEMAELLCQMLPSLEQVRLVSSGTEATMSAIRLARGFTGRAGVLKFEGCYHGHADSLLVKAGSGLLTFGSPTSAGVPADFVKHTHVLPYNNVEALARLFAEQGQSLACVIVEPIAGNMNLVRPATGFLEALRSLCTQHGVVLIFDEVMTGFRVGPQGAQGLYGVVPDLTTLGKVIGGGLPVGAFGGRRDIMACVAPLGPVYQAGTLSGNPVAVAAGLATLKCIHVPGFYEYLATQAQCLVKGLCALASQHGLPFAADAVGGMFGLYFTATVPQGLEDVQRSNVDQFKRFFHAMLQQGVYLAPSAFEAGFISAAHNADVLDATFQAANVAFSQVAAESSCKSTVNPL